mmetsp:Transcript_23081/g.50658  ORF Transcript_23081/g.50658 Transcript_23081/m.50658 type:complete len:95 (+) Transcript_23081:468-752(+)
MRHTYYRVLSSCFHTVHVHKTSTCTHLRLRAYIKNISTLALCTSVVQSSSCTASSSSLPMPPGAHLAPFLTLVTCGTHGEAKSTSSHVSTTGRC